MFKRLFDWLNSYVTYTAKVLVCSFVLLTLCFLLLFIGLTADGVGVGHFISQANAGTGGQIVFFVFVGVWALGLLTAFFAQRDK